MITDVRLGDRLQRACATLARSTASSTRERRRTPAVSTSRKSRPSRWNGTRMLSRVVPGCSLAITRSSPIRRLTSVDLPTLGRPMIATRIALGRRSGSGAGCRPRGPSQHRVDQLAAALAVRGRDRLRRAQPEHVKIGRHQVGVQALGLVERQHHRLARAAQLARDELILGGQPGARIREENQMRSASATAFSVCTRICASSPCGCSISPPVSISTQGTRADARVAVLPVARDARARRRRSLAACASAH